VADESNGGQMIPPPSEEVHLPEPSYLPALTALGITLAVVGIVLSWIICGMGVVIAVVAIVRWVRQTREEMAELPLEH
jgi:hypothetical protein